MIKRIYFSSIQKILEFIYKFNNDGIKIYMFHRVYENELPIHEKDIAISKDRFECFINQIHENGIKIIPITDFQSHLASNYACITFDDVYSDAIENAVPLLIENNIPFALFIATNLIGKDQFISLEQICKLRNCPLCTIGFHTNGHVIMRDKNEGLIYEELNCSDLEEFLKIEIKDFAFPYGSIFAVNKTARKLAKKMGYSHIFSTLSMPINDLVFKKFNNFLPRININDQNYKKY